MPRHLTGEDLIQATIMADLRCAGVLAIHCPNESKGPQAWHSKRYAMGVHAGVSDILIFDPPPAFPGYRGASLEHKDGPKPKPTPAQLRWLADLAARQWLIAVERSIDASRARLVLWGYLPPSILSACSPSVASSMPSSTPKSRGRRPSSASSTRRRSRST